ncbi:MAG: hypothetical protein K2Z81_24315, partial [Cyanobacteria bacterium]|nr:hypothetical protein [Cyanobacteriota bacterium]
LKEKMLSVKGVDQVHVNPRTGTVVVHHDSEHETIHGIGEVLKECSTELFECIVKGENPALAGVHLFTQALMEGDGKSDDSRLWTAAAGILVVMLMLPEFPVKV